MKILRVIKQNIPNTITCMNLLSGCLACVFAFKFGDSFGSLKGYEMAFLMIGLAAFFDFFDGLSARLLHAYSNLGKELDSLSDLVSFGVAPAALVFNLIETQTHSPLAYLAFLIPVFGALRLARFNIDDRQTTSFIGLPIPANAIFWIGLVAWNMQYYYLGNLFMTVMMLAFPLLMVCDVRMFSLKVKTFALAPNVRRYALLLGAIGFVSYAHVAGLMWTVIFYIFLSATAKKTEHF